MNRHAGASFTLSVLIVAFFGVVLYQPETQSVPSPRKATAARKRSATEPPAHRPPPPPPTPGVPLAEAEAESAPSPPSPLRPTSSSVTSHRLQPPRASVASAPGLARISSRPKTPRKPALANSTVSPTIRASEPLRTVSRRLPVPSKPRSAFTEAVDGESLKDVALRVYGDPNSVRTLWLANRDILNDQKSPLRAGTLLRTPDN